MQHRNDELYAAISRARRAVVEAGDIALSMGRSTIEHDLFEIHQELYRIATSVYEAQRLKRLQTQLDLAAGSGDAEPSKAATRPQRREGLRPGG